MGPLIGVAALPIPMGLFVWLVNGRVVPLWAGIAGGYALLAVFAALGLAFELLG